MKTKKCRPVLVKSKEPTNLILSGFGTLFLSPPMQLKTSDTYQQLILISLEDEKIKAGELCYNVSNNCIVRFSNWPYPDYSNHKKIVATQSQLPIDYINQFIEEYNTGNVKDLEIEMEIDELSTKIRNSSEHKFENYKFVNSIFKPKLINGFVTIVEREIDIDVDMPGEFVKYKEPILYTEEEVLNLLSKLAMNTTCRYCDEPGNWDITESDDYLMDWFEPNKKK